jgi:hypothetical protein
MLPTNIRMRALGQFTVLRAHLGQLRLADRANGSPLANGPEGLAALCSYLVHEAVLGLSGTASCTGTRSRSSTRQAS